MKSFIFTVAFLMLSSAHAATALQSQAIQRLVCSEISESYKAKGVNSTNCMAATFYFSKAPVQVTIADTTFTTQMYVRGTVADIDFEATVTASIFVNSEGGIEQNGWLVTAADAVNFGDISLLTQSTSYMENVSEISDLKTIPAKVLKKINAYEIPDWALDPESNDVETDGPTYYAVYRPGSQKLIGYIIEGFIASESQDAKASWSATFDLTGELIDESYESFNYHE